MYGQAVRLAPLHFRLLSTVRSKFRRFGHLPSPCRLSLRGRTGAALTSTQIAAKGLVVVLVVAADVDKLGEMPAAVKIRDSNGGRVSRGMHRSGKWHVTVMFMDGMSL